MTTNTGPLDGLRVVDFSTTPAGAQATQTLADFGAEVVHVEPPGGSPLRDIPAYPFLGRGKRSIVLDLHEEADRATARDLALGADVLIETYRPDVIEGFGLGYDDLSVANPGLVYGSVTGWGRTGPYANAKGYEALIMARTGALTVSGPMVTRPGPAHVSMPYCTYAASQHLLTGVLAALHERESSGHGQRVDASLVKGLHSLGTWNWYLHIVTSKFPDAFTPSSPVNEDGIPLSPLFFMLLIAPSKDGRWMQFSQVQPHLYMAMLAEMGMADMLGDDEWKTALFAMDTPEKTEIVWEKLITAAQSKTLAEWQEVFERNHDVWAETFRRDAELLGHPQIQHLDAVIELDDAERGTVRQPGPIARLDGTPGVITASAPGLDADGMALRATPWEAKPTVVPGTPSTDAPLAGVTVLELGTFFAAPYAGTILAELGARVVKVEPLEGEPMRNILPFPEIGGAKCLQGKESIALDLGTDEGREIVHKIAAEADLVLESFRAGKAAKQGVDEKTLRALNPDLVYLSSPGYGIDGPCGDRPAFAPTIGAGTGIVMRNLGSTVPEKPGMSVKEVREHSLRLSPAGTTEYAQADGVSAVTAASAMTLGLLARDRTGTAQSMLTTMLTSNSHALFEDMVQYEGRGPTLHADDQLYGYGARYRLYEANDGWIYLTAPAEDEWDDLVAALAPHVDLGADERFGSAESRRENDDALAEVLAGVFAGGSAQGWEDTLLAADVGCVKVAEDGPEVVMQSDEFAGASDLLVEVSHPTFDEHPRMKSLLEFSRSATIEKPGVLCGQHTDLVLEWLGYDAEAIADLRERNVVTG